MANELEQQKRQVESEARKERQRLASQARAERERMEAQAKAIRDKLAKEAREAQDRIRRQQSIAEREAEAAKARARKAERREQRKRALPLTRPADLGTAQTIAAIEKQRVEAHKEGGKVRAEIEAEKVKGLSDIESQQAKAEADIEAQQAKAEAKITKWQTESLERIAEAEKAQAEAEAEAKKREREWYREAERERLAFERANVKLDTGEYIDKTAYSELEKEDRSYLKEHGVVAFNSWQEAKGVKFEAENVKLDTGEWVSKSAFNSIVDQKGRAYITEHGIEKFNKWAEDEYAVSVTAEGVVFPEGQEGIGQFEWLKSSGDIPKTAVFESYSKATGEVSYSIPPKPESVVLFGAQMPEGTFKDVMLNLRHTLAVDEAHLKGEIFGIKNPELERAAAQVNRFFDLLAPKVEANMASEPVEFAKETALQVASYMPLVWAVNWNKMSTSDRIVNGAIDAVIIATVGLGFGLRALNARKITTIATQAGKAAENMNRSLKVLASTPLTSKKYANVASSAQKAIQASRVADARFFTQLERVKSITSGQLSSIERRSGIRGLKPAILEVNKAQTALDKAWIRANKYPMGSKKYIANLPAVTAAQNRLASALEVFSSKLKPRYPFNPSPEFKGFAMEWRQGVLPTFEGGQPKVVPLKPDGKGVQLAVLERQKAKLKLKPYHELKMKPVYTEPGAKVATRRAAPKVKATAKVSVAPALSATRGAYDPAHRERLYERPDVREQILADVVGKPLVATKTALAHQTEVKLVEVTNAAIKAANKAMGANMTDAHIRGAVEAAVLTEVKAITQTEVKTVVKTKVKACLLYTSPSPRDRS